MSKLITTCPTCGSVCTRGEYPRGGDYGWGGPETRIKYTPVPSELDTLRRQLAEAEALLNTPQEPLFSYRHFKERAEAAEAKLALAEQDARRYRFIRDRAAKLAIYSDVPVDVLINGEWQDQPDQLDATVTAAIAAGEGKGD